MPPIQTIQIKHHFEAAHRLSCTQGKCERIHGHSWRVALELGGEVEEDTGMLLGLDFSDLKRAFRHYIDSSYDHHLLLNASDPLTKFDLPGAMLVGSGDPTTENLAKAIGEWCAFEFAGSDITTIKATLWETETNMATWASLNGAL